MGSVYLAATSDENRGQVMGMRGSAISLVIMFGHGGAFVLVQGIEVGLAVAAETVGIDELAHGHLLSGVGIDFACGGRSGGRRGTRPGRSLTQPFLNQIMALIAAAARQLGLQPVEIVPPFPREARGIVQVSLIQRLDIGGVAAV